MKILNTSSDPTDALDRISDDYDLNRLTYNDVTQWYEKPTIKISITAFIKQLPPAERLVLELYYYQELPQREIAEIVGITQGSVSQRLNRLQKRLKFLYKMESLMIPPANIDTDLIDFFGRVDIALYKLMMETLSLTQTMRELQSIYPEYEFSYTKVRQSWKGIQHRIVLLKSPTLEKYVVLARYIDRHKYEMINTYD